MVPGSPQPVVHVSQYDDNSRDIVFELFNDRQPFEIPEDCLVTCDGTKPDKNFFAFECTYEGNTVTVRLKKQMDIVKGSVPCQITIYPLDGSASIGSANFTLRVEKGAVQTDEMSETQIESLNQVMQDTLKARDEAEQIFEDMQDFAEEATKKVNDLADEKISEMETIADKYDKMIKNPVGYFATSEDLKAAFPTAEVYDWAVVGEDGTIWQWNDEKQQWENGGGQLQAKVFSRKVTLSAGEWENSAQTVTVEGVLEDEDKQLILIIPTTADLPAYKTASIQATEQATDSIKFVAEMEPPSVDVQVYVYVQEVFT